jgi:hypothetical protein
VGSFSGGSAYAMAKDIGEGFVLVTERTYQRLATGELEQLAFELDRALRDTRGTQPALDDQAALQQRNRKISRLTGALTMLRSYQVRFRSRGPSRPGGAA